ncbi:hypothetical protein GE253_22920 [Niveispirillum sp. SYP-B3756]|uniref:hypothetical protein n=1 Tax=Niveispirillum sp. SYP-B3756 TaxID=2662178 RepID=UPI001291E498|nr:hypothetical protein [Niveispirillum sp. SYP-B3756]MQP68175.1 hypothetical protein [Niveispirillum sp. SYP-B3756]
MRIYVSQIFTAVLASVVLTACSTGAQLQGPGRHQYLIREACANRPLESSRGGLNYTFGLDVDLSLRETRNVRLTRAASGQEERYTEAMHGGGGKECAGGEVVATTMMPDGRFKFRYEFAGIIENGSRRDEFVRVTIEDKIRYNPGAQSAGMSKGVAYRFYLD